jgi:hypothetical protein
MFYRRTTHVAELQMGIPANRLEDACAIDHFDTSRLPFITLLGELIDFFSGNIFLSFQGKFFLCGNFIY